MDEEPIIDKEYKPSVVKPVVGTCLTAHAIFRNQMNARIEIMTAKYNKILEGAF